MKKPASDAQKAAKFKEGAKQLGIESMKLRLKFSDGSKVKKKVKLGGK